MVGSPGQTPETLAEDFLFLKKLDPDITVIGKACPLFVPLVEEGWTHDPVTVEVASRYLKELQEKGIDTLILGCTHYPLLRSTIRKIMVPEELTAASASWPSRLPTISASTVLYNC